MAENILQELYDACLEFLNDIDMIEKDLNEYISDAVSEDLTEIFWRNIKSEFYDKYKPKRYYRKRSLYKAYKIKKTINGVEWDFSPEYMPEGQHRVSNEYIFENSFIKGYHGGADDIKDVENSRYKNPHPNIGTPYWRTPYPDGKNPPYQFWYKPAPKEKVPPIEAIENDVNNYITKKSDTSIGHFYEDRIKEAFGLMKSKYKLFRLIKK